MKVFSASHRFAQSHKCKPFLQIRGFFSEKPFFFSVFWRRSARSFSYDPAYFIQSQAAKIRKAKTYVLFKSGFLLFKIHILSVFDSSELPILLNFNCLSGRTGVSCMITGGERNIISHTGLSHTYALSGDISPAPTRTPWEGGMHRQDFQPRAEENL